MCLKNSALHEQKNTKNISFPFSLQFPYQTKELTGFRSSSRGINYIGWYSPTVCQSEVFTFNPPALPQFLAQTQNNLLILLTELEQIMDRCIPAIYIQYED